MLAVEFGSRRRGDFKKFSDRDMLIIGDDCSNLNAEKKEKERQGYSVTAFSSTRARFLIKSGSLFFKHIFDEGELLEGRLLDFNDLKRSWTGKNNYEDEIEDNLYLLEVLKHLPSNNHGLVVANDIIITSIRNILIRKLAEYGLYIFSWEHVFNKSADFGLIRKEHIPVLLCSRVIKNAYRTGFIPRIDKGLFDKIVVISSHVFGKNGNVRFAGRREVFTLPAKCEERSYKQLRALELMCAEYQFHGSLDIYRESICNPSYFCAMGIRSKH